MLRLLSLIEPLNPSTYHRVFSHRRWHAGRFAKVIATFVIDRFYPDGIVRVVGDETVDGHRGKKVYGKARHRDAVQSTHSHTVYRYGHKWVVLAVLIQLPGVGRPMALPLLIALYRDQKTNAAEGRRHKTQAQLMCGLLALLMRWFPQRKFAFAGDNVSGTHQMCRFAYRHRRQLSPVRKFIADVNLYRPPPRRKLGINGRPRIKGASLPKPCEIVGSRRGGR
ncbi:hypothetical protein RRSWK_05831 [Rhodopirellula sp. SWK7]|nr:hypothetical protein RRSWK_05831 [Rhodopirellula sp. SWK7]